MHTGYLIGHETPLTLRCWSGAAVSLSTVSTSLWCPLQFLTGLGFLAPLPHMGFHQFMTRFIRGIIALAACAILLTRPTLAQGSQTTQTTPALDRNILLADRGNNRIIEVTPDK